MNLNDLKALFTEDRAVSPVIGVILMVAITVILAAVIGTFVLGMGDDLQNNQPTASFNMDFEAGGTVTISHAGGDTISGDDSVTVTATGDGLSDGGSWSTPITAGDSKQFNSAASVDGSQAWTGQTVSVNWESADGTSSAQLGAQQAPDNS
ncbi:type IV pilin [Halopenitus persicus]|uniref:Flagellin N-terminal-like domain-containing protein n=1 Tax=Halopenitus persicus TaxID=1048396 RepID=A0A1H3JL11_9EURY|nr:type IV pilin N-terminal domain-containing protein [Halopenitus persicus]SDY40269.1 flagellin N-terminal-like domain-containing protein [Halopenitus persicus]